MRLLFFGNNWLGWQVVAWLRAQGEEIVGLVLHPPARRAYGTEIISSAGVAPSCIFDGSQLGQAEVSTAIKILKPELGISVLFGYILRQEVLELMPGGCVNIHPAFLPYNRGAYPNVWSIVDGTPAGVTLHYMDKGIDTGDIIAQQQIPVEPIDTGKSLYHKLERAALNLFKETWPLIRSGQTPRIPQREEAGTYHRVRDVGRLDEIDLSRSYTAAELINIFRARTYPPYPGAYFWQGQRKIYIRLQLLSEEELATEVNER